MCLGEAVEGWERSKMRSEQFSLVPCSRYNICSALFSIAANLTENKHTDNQGSRAVSIPESPVNKLYSVGEPVTSYAVLTRYSLTPNYAPAAAACRLVFRQELRLLHCCPDQSF